MRRTRSIQEKKRKVLDWKTRKKGKHRERKEREKKKREKRRKTYHVSCDFQDGRLRVVTGTRHLTVSSSLFSKSSEYSGFSLVPRAASLDRERYDCSSKNSRIGRERVPVSYLECHFIAFYIRCKKLLHLVSAGYAKEKLYVWDSL